MRVRGAVRAWCVAVSVCAPLLLTACGGDGAGPGESPSVSSEDTPTSSLPVWTAPETSATSGGSETTGTSETTPTPVPKALDGNAVEKAVRSVLTGSYGIKDVERVRCPQRPTVAEGLTFDCTAVIGGDSKRVPIEILDDEGRYEVGLPV